MSKTTSWGDASELIALLDVQPVDDLRYRCAARPSSFHRAVVEGSQLLGQAIVAAAREAPGARPVSASMVFLKPVSVDASYDVVLEPLSRGRTFNAFAVRVVQGDRLGAAGTLLLDATAPAVVTHQDPAPDVPGPHDCLPYDMAVTGREIRVVDGAYTNDSAAPVGPPVLDAWVRFDEVPDDPALHAALLAQFTGHLSIAAALRPHAGIGQDQAHVSISTAVNAISLSLHADVRADAWMRYHHRSTVAVDGMTHSECSVLDESGRRLASFNAECMLRGFAGAAPGDARTAL